MVLRLTGRPRGTHHGEDGPERVRGQHSDGAPLAYALLSSKGKG